MNEVLTREQRKLYVSRVEVLEKVKALLTVPQLCIPSPCHSLHGDDAPGL